jgi:hypothetical protein
MVETVRQEQIQLLPEYQETFLKDLLASTTARAGEPTVIPERVVAPLSDAQQRAIDLGIAGVGDYQPMMQAGEQTLAGGVGAYEQAMQQALGATPLFQQAAATTMGTMGAFDPRSYQQFMDPYTEDVIAQAQRDIQRQGDIQRQQIGAQAVGQGAFGGSRQAIAEQELQRNLSDQFARTSAGLRSAGFQQAQQQAQQAFADQMARQQQGAQLFGQLGQGMGQLGQGLGSIAGGLARTGLSQAALGESAQAAQQRDINALLSLGGLEQQQAQQQQEALRATALERQFEPYQRIGFMSDIFRGVPTTQSSLQSTTAPSPSTISQIAGLGVGLAGLNQAGLFGAGGLPGLLGIGQQG